MDTQARIRELRQTDLDLAAAAKEFEADGDQAAARLAQRLGAAAGRLATTIERAEP